MKLTRFRVKDFRSVVDTGWITCHDVTAFAGENESGKSTLLIAILRLLDSKPDAVTRPSGSYVKSTWKNDVPIERFDELFPVINDKIFAYGEFEPAKGETFHDELKAISPTYTPKKTFTISKTYGGKYDSDILKMFAPEQHEQVLDVIAKCLPRAIYYSEVTEISSKIDLLALALKLEGLATSRLTPREEMISNLLSYLDIWESNLIKSIISVHDKLELDNKSEVDFIKIFEAIPLFYKRVEKGFQQLNKEFLKWWGKDDLKIGFEPYKRGILIKIIDLAGNEFLLENRSTGFRRFFALFLSFSVSEREKFKNTLLLFDEAGAALHPLTQRKLENYFHELGKHTQILYNTHTSYMLSVKNMNHIKVVYKDGEGHTQVSTSLTINPDRTNEMSLFPVQSALALYVAEKQMAGCVPIVVLYDSDEFYISLIKNVLSAKGKFDTVYTPLVIATGENGIDAAAEAFSAGEDLPKVFLASDERSREIKARLLQGAYKKSQQKVLELSDFVPDVENFEDIIPSNFVEIFSRLYLKEILGDNFVYNKEVKLLKQIEEYAQANDIILPNNYRSEMAKRMKINTMIYFRDVNIPGKYVRIWTKMWYKLLSR